MPELGTALLATLIIDAIVVVWWAPAQTAAYHQVGDDKAHVGAHNRAASARLKSSRVRQSKPCRRGDPTCLRHNGAARISARSAGSRRWPKSPCITVAAEL